MRLRAIVTRGEVTREVLEKRASMLRKDSVHGYFKGSVKIDVEQQALIINGTTVFVISANAPEDPDYTQFGINDALIIARTASMNVSNWPLSSDAPRAKMRSLPSLSVFMTGSKGGEFHSSSGSGGWTS